MRKSLLVESALLMLTALSIPVGSAASQSVITVPDEVACAKCSIVLRSTTVLGSLEDT